MLTTLPSFIPAAFLPLALAHFLALLSPGPDFFLIIDRSVRHRLCGAVFICLGIALNAVHIALAAAGWAVRRQLLAGGLSPAQSEKCDLLSAIDDGHPWPEYDSGPTDFAGIWMTALVLVWDVSLARLISLPGMQRRQWQCIPIIEGMVGGVLVLLAVLLVILPFFVVQFCTVRAFVGGLVIPQTKSRQYLGNTG